MKQISQPVVKKDAAALLSGKPVYTDDLAMKDCLIISFFSKNETGFGSYYIEALESNAVSYDVLYFVCFEESFDCLWAIEESSAAIRRHEERNRFRGVRPQKFGDCFV